jgi:hypothetical protein
VPSLSRRARVPLALTLLLLAFTAMTPWLTTMTPALAAEERVPDEVSDYIERRLVPRLADLYAPGADAASGADFDESTTVGEVVRVREWRRSFMEGEVTAADAGSTVELANRWVAPVSIAETVVGLATVWVNPANGAAELAEFDFRPGLAVAIATMPTDAVLVRHGPTASWFAVTDATASPIDAGSTGIAAPVSLDDLARSFAAAAGEEPGGASPAGLLPAAVLLAALAAVVGVVLWPGRRVRNGGTPAPPTA